MINSKYWEKKLREFLEIDGISDIEFFNYMAQRTTRLPLTVEEFGWGVFPIEDNNGILIDIRMVVPNIYDEKSLCVNIHEYTHAYELYSCLGSIFQWDIKASEEKAISAEKRYLNIKNNMICTKE